ncbi:outer membrane protein [Maribacter aurantiacus]|uniref:Porin family protein n=1 Tax=Maribacter aurantiacus TaxID=1882343 RepID=A0A5R8MA63_9FLAO|nr:outer membrane beta-barrel protein [Maribacter aurantiacus]TLF46453.1 porin family protein [Maribacter aurantiacus]
MRQQATLFLIMFFASLSTSAQDGEFSATLGYPIPFGENFVSQNYTGVVDLGLQYRFANLEVLRLGGSINGSYYVFPGNPAPRTDKVNAIFIQPRIFGELKLPGLQKFRPDLGIGYSFTTFSAKLDGSNGENFKEKYGGINANAGFNYFITDRFFTHAHYDFLKLSRDDVPETRQNTTIHQIKFGIGLSF